jgi:hypothetical protein
VQRNTSLCKPAQEGVCECVHCARVWWSRLASMARCVCVQWVEGRDAPFCRLVELCHTTDLVEVGHQRFFCVVPLARSEVTVRLDQVMVPSLGRDVVQAPAFKAQRQLFGNKPTVQAVRSDRREGAGPCQCWQRTMSGCEYTAAAGCAWSSATGT